VAYEKGENYPISYRHDFRRIKFTEHKTRVLIFSTNLYETFLILRIIELDKIKMCIGLHVKYPFSRMNQISIITKMRLMEPSCSMRTDVDGPTKRSL
jgi:hypothetical protein